jgi:hypothetical protein
MSRKCHQCGTSLSRSAASCPECGAAERVELVDAVLTEWNADTGDARLSVDDPLGTRSVSHGDQGQVTVEVEGTGGIGAQAEGRIVAMLRDAVAATGLSVTLKDGADDRGDDRKLEVNDRTYGIQVTVAPSARSFWREAAMSSASTHVNRSHALQWLREPIATKAHGVSAHQLSRTVLAIDVTHAGVMADPYFRAGYVQQFGCPSAEFGFASVWLVGPTSQYCGRLGNGFP